VPVPVAALPPQEKAALVVVTTVQRGVFSGAARIRFVDQEGGLVKAFPSAPPFLAARDYTSPLQALAAGRITAAAIAPAVDLAPVLDLADGPLGSRQFRSPTNAVAFARGLGRFACVKHFPGLGSAAVSTDERPHVDAVLRAQDLAPFRAAIRAGVRCVMVGHAFYRRFGALRASLEPATYRLLRSLGFRGVAITDSLSIVAHPPRDWPVAAARAGADLLLFTSPKHARAAIEELLPLARSGELDEHVARVLSFRARYAVR
jgi:beta-N-acetylhexosaminidase